MCMFCAAVPAVAALGAAADGEQRKKIKADDAARIKPRPYGKLTLLAIVTLLAISALYHTQRPA